MPTQDYQLECLIGRGSFGEVYRARKIDTSEIFAIKMIDTDEASDVRELAKEIHFLTRVRSPYLTRHYETFVQERKMWIVLEYCGGGLCLDLLKCFGRLSELVTAYILRDVLHGLDYLHRQHKVHRDIKLANILLTDAGEVKLGDFGVSGEMSLTRTRRNTMVGTPYWMAPEVITHLPHGYDSKADIWSTGITCIEFATGRPPLAALDPMEALFKIPQNKSPELDDTFSADIRDFVRYCCLKVPRQRPAASTLLHHRFISACPRDVDLGQLVAKKKTKEKLRKPRRPKVKKTPHMPTIHWKFTQTFSAVPAGYGALVDGAFARMLDRAKTEHARKTVARLQREFSVAERANAGFCHAFVEELGVSREPEEE